MGKIVTTTNLSEARGNLPRLSKTVLSVAVAMVFSAAAISPADAAGLGRLTVQSALGQPLQAQVEVTSLTESEAASLSAKLASSDAFRQAGLEFNPALSNLRFKINRTNGGRALVDITSTRPINEPFVDLLVELNWSTGKFVREYTFLLDPPELRLGRDETVAGGATLVTPAPTVQQPVAIAQPQAVAITPAPAPAAQLPIAKTEPLPSASGSVSTQPAPVVVSELPAPVPASPAPVAQTNVSAELPGTVRVARGDTLGNIARGLQANGFTLDQAIVAIYRANPDAFFGSVHQLRAGSTLAIPSASEIAAYTPGEVRSEMRASNKTWRDYRARLAAAAQSTTTVSAPAPSGSAAVGNIAKAPTDTSPATSDGDQLKLSRETTDSGSSAGGTTASSAESSFARDAALQDAQSRVTELERNVSDLQRLLELKNKQLSDLSDQVSAAQTAQAEPAAPTDTGAVAETEPTPAAAEPTETVATAPTDSAATDPATSEATTDATAASTTEAEPATDAAATTAETTPVLTDPVAAADAAATKAAEAVGQSVDAASSATTNAVETVSDQGGGVVDKIVSTVSNPMVAGTGIGLLALLGGLFFWKRRSGKAEDEFEDTMSSGDDAFAANSLFGTTGGQDVDTSASNSLFNTEVGNTTVGEESTVDVHSTEVDPIAEAEVYIAYGREAQAEEILKEALKRQPERQAIRLKLLEIYAGRKDSTAYSSVAREMYDMTNGQNEEWPKVITMGLSIDPTNTLYTGEGEDLDHPTTMISPSTAGSAGVAAAAGVAGAAGASALVDALSSDPQTEIVDSSPASKIDPMTTTQATNDELSSLDFDLDISTEMDSSPDSVAPIDTQLGSGLSEDHSLSAALSDNVDMPSLELGGDTIAAQPTTVADLSPSTMASPEAGDVDLSAIGLDLEPASGGAPAGSDPARWQEMATKLDLASAYEEIGDKEGARELLDEVIKGGDDAQQQKAQSMLSKIA